MKDGRSTEVLARFDESNSTVVSPRTSPSCGHITAGLTPARVGAWRNRPHGAALLQQVLDKRSADAKQHRQSTLRATVCVIGTDNFLTKIEGVGFHIRAC